MKIVIQRSKESSVVVNSEIVGKISHGMVVLLCFEKGDSELLLEKAIHRTINIRMFEDPQTGKMSQNISQVSGQILCISQFTLSWEGEKGHRPSFDNALEPAEAKRLYEIFCAKIRAQGIPVECGVFGAYMSVNIANDGPVTFYFKF
ncbi:MAG: D-tyrosyl-tRNA(Tyr) deacylase [Oligoflexia bacterium]|nr:D-tyrosyl-tRNA(Tyr) deacylase [Oligoflexia bacterium]MBF0364433.1 D-tyrosyl-tRNA(Tyr) deacylase [Oligoflexia bacterium]